jgi:hypothetical protein
MTIHYGVLAHNNPIHLAELIRALSPHPVYIHLDAKSDLRDFAGIERVHFVANRLDVKWAGWSLVGATLALLSDILPFIDENDYVVLLSGDSYPLQPQDAIVDFFSSSNGAQFINTVRMPSTVVEKPLTRISRFYVEYDPRDQRKHLFARLINKMSIPRSYEKAFGDLRPYCGSQWWALSGAAVKWVSKEIESRKRFVKFAKNTCVPDEYFFQTLLMASPYAGSIRKSVMYADFTDARGPRPSRIAERHIEMIGAAENHSVEHAGYGTGPVLFARKFSDASADVRSNVRTSLWPNVVNFPRDNVVGC